MEWKMGEKLSVVFVFLLVSGATAIAQNATSAFNDSSSVWYVADSRFMASPSSPLLAETRTIEYNLPRDTVINGETWRVMESYDHLDNITNFEGYVRQFGGHYLYLDAFGVLDTLYDFNLSLGDVVYFEQLNYHTVVQVDSVLINSTYHERIFFDTLFVSLSGYSMDVWIEGIGSIHGPLAPSRLYDQYTDVTSFPDSLRLACFENSNGVIWSNPNYSNCINTILQSTTELEGLNSGIQMTVLDNPVQQNGKFWVELDSSKPFSAKRFDFHLHDELGRLVSTAQTRQGSLPNGNGQVELDAPSKPGLFQLSIMVEGERVASTKVLVL